MPKDITKQPLEPVAEGMSKFGSANGVDRAGLSVSRIFAPPEGMVGASGNEIESRLVDALSNREDLWELAGGESDVRWTLGTGATAGKVDGGTRMSPL
jgi:hypothetical protein